MNKIYIGSDHAGVELLEYVRKYLIENGYEVDITKIEGDNVDYPDVAKELCRKVINNNSRGIAICGTGIGMSIASNKVKGIRASICYDEFTAEMARKHNNLNMLCLGARTSIGKDFDKVKAIIHIYLNTDFEGGRHQKRIDKLEMEK
ncbi:MAG: ribose 5-phosphate isomerase B [Clostridia bacterium]